MPGERKKTQQQQESLLSAEWRARRKGTCGAVRGRTVEDRDGETKEGYEGEEGKQKAKGSL